MSASALPQFQAATFARLRSRPDFMRLITGLFDAVPQGQEYPYAVLDSMNESPDRTLGQNGHQIIALFSIYTQDGSTTRSGRGTAGAANGSRIAAMLAEILLDPDEPLVVDDHDLVDLDIDSIVSDRETDNITRRTDVTLVVQLEDHI